MLFFNAGLPSQPPQDLQVRRPEERAQHRGDHGHQRRKEFQETDLQVETSVANTHTLSLSLSLSLSFTQQQDGSMR